MTIDPELLHEGAHALALLADPLTLTAILAIVVLAAVIQFGLGMGFGLFAAPLLALIDPLLVPAPTLFLGMATSGLTAVRERSAIVWPEVWIAALGRIVGMLAATALLAALTDRETFSLVFGLMLALAVAMSLLGLRLPFSRPALGAMGGVSGLMGTITSVGAPPLAILYQDRSSTRARPTLAAFFSIGCAISLVGLFAAGWATWADAILALVMAPGMLVGGLISARLRGAFDARFRPFLLAISGLAALILILRGLA